MNDEKDVDTEVVPKIKAEIEEFDFNSDDIVIVTDSDNKESVQERRDQSSPVSNKEPSGLVYYCLSRFLERRLEAVKR